MTRASHLSRRAMLATTGAGLSVLGTARAAAAAAPAVPRIDGAAVSDFPHYWEACVGSDRASVAMRADWRRDLAVTRREAGFRSVRFHGLLDDDMGLCRRIGPDGPELNFLYIDQIFDAMLAIGVRPFVELSFMPLPLASSQNSIFWYKGNTSPPNSLDNWVKLIDGLARHLLARYGAAEVTGWRFEVWNEPNLSFWAGTQAEYFAFYAATARALKAVHPALQVGGPATAQLMWIGEFLAYCAEHNAPVDFVSSHIYADDPQENLFGREMNYPREEVIPRALAVANGKIRSSAFPKLPLVISEWTSQNPAFIAQMIRDCAGLCDTFSYWTFDNIFEERGPIDSYSNELYGLMRQGGVPRPSFRTFQLLHRLGDRRLETGKAPMIATRKANGGLAILAWNLVTNADVSSLAGNPMAAPGGEPILDGPARTLTLDLPARHAGQVRVTTVDTAHDPAEQLHASFGKPASPTPAQLDQMRRAEVLSRPTRLRQNGHRISVSVPANGVALIETA